MNNTDIYEFDGMEYYLETAQEIEEETAVVHGEAAQTGYLETAQEIGEETAAVQSEAAQTSMSEGFAIATAGFIIVFFVLVIISVILSLLKYTNPQNRKEDKKAVQAAKTEETELEQENEYIIEEVDYSDDLELVAVITACIAASTNTSSDKLVVRSIRRLSSWNRETRHEQQRIYF